MRDAVQISHLTEKRKSRSFINDCLVQAEVIDSQGGNSWLTWIKLVLKCFASETGEINLKFVLDDVKKSHLDLCGMNASFRTINCELLQILNAIANEKIIFKPFLLQTDAILRGLE